MRVNILWIFFVLFIVDTFGQTEDDELDKEHKIVGGELLNIQDVPYIVHFTKNEGSWCGGSLISRIWILSAAHCFYNQNADAIKVRVGSSRQSSGGRTYKISLIKTHPLYNPTNSQDYDATLLKIRGFVTLSSRVKIIALPTENQIYSDGTTVLVSGWGDTKNINQPQEMLRGVILKTVNRDDCNTTYEGEITNQMICATYEIVDDQDVIPKDSCQGKLIQLNVSVN